MSSYIDLMKNVKKGNKIQGDRYLTWSYCWEVNFTKLKLIKRQKKTNKGKVEFSKIRSIKVEKFMIVNDDANYIV